MNTDIDQAREYVINQVLDATTLAEIEDAWRVLRGWLQAHPEEQGMRAGFEQLSLLQDVADAEAQRVHSTDASLPTGEAA